MAREGQHPQILEQAEETPDPLRRDPLRQISTWSVAIQATIAVGFVLHLAREVVLPVVAAFIVGVMLEPAAR